MAFCHAVLVRMLYFAIKQLDGKCEYSNTLKYWKKVLKPEGGGDVALSIIICLAAEHRERGTGRFWALPSKSHWEEHRSTEQ